MTDKQLTIQTNWRYYFKPFVIGLLLSPFIVGLIILLTYYFKQKNNTYTVTDEQIRSNSTGESIFIDSIDSVKIKNQVKRHGIRISDVLITTLSNTFVIQGIENGEIIKQSIDDLIALKNELKESARIRSQVEIKQDPGSLERLNDLAGLLQEGLISYDDYLQERNKFEDIR